MVPFLVSIQIPSRRWDSYKDLKTNKYSKHITWVPTKLVPQMGVCLKRFMERNDKKKIVLSINKQLKNGNIFTFLYLIQALHWMVTTITVPRNKPQHTKWEDYEKNQFTSKIIIIEWYSKFVVFMEILANSSRTCI